MENKYQEALDKMCNRCFDDEPRKVLQELVDKEKPKKPIHHTNSFYRCETCDGLFQNHHYQNCCPNCGQALDWSGN